jgi:hypothetical protein
MIEVRKADGRATRTIQRDGISTEVIEVTAGECGHGTVHVGAYCLDENHAAALALALQAAVAEIQARAVGR